MRATTEQAIAKLRKQHQKARKAPESDPTWLMADEVQINEAAFQVRGPAKNYKRETFIDELARTLKARGNAELLEPVVVWWAGKWMLVDGHHRMAAHRKALGAGFKVPVKVFKGTPDQALLLAGQLNYRTKLAMSAAERADAAWRFVVLVPKATRSQIAAATGVSDTTIGEQRRVNKELSRRADVALTELSILRRPEEMGWNEARRLERGLGSSSYDHEDALQGKVAAAMRMLAPLTECIHKNPEAFSLALRGIAPDFEVGIMEEAFEASWMTEERQSTSTEARYVAHLTEVVKTQSKEYDKRQREEIDKYRLEQLGDPEESGWM